MEHINIQALHEEIEGLDSFQCGAYGNRCAVALEAENHSPNVNIVIQGDSPENLNLFWETPKERDGYREPKKNVEVEPLQSLCY